MTYAHIINYDVYFTWMNVNGSTNRSTFTDLGKELLQRNKTRLILQAVNKLMGLCHDFLHHFDNDMSHLKYFLSNVSKFLRMNFLKPGTTDCNKCTLKSKVQKYTVYTPILLLNLTFK